MRHRDFASFIFPSALAMLLFIALPIVSVAVQSLFVEHDQVLISVESCGPFGCQTETKVDPAATAALKTAQPLGKFNGLGTYLNRAHLAVSEIGEILSNNDGVADIVAQIYNLPFYKALSFTLVYTFLVTPLSMAVGFAVALGVNTIPRMFKGPVIFLSLLPYIVTPLLGSLILFWMINSDGVIGASLQWIFADPELSLKASPVLTWVTLIVYGTWHMTPFAFVVFYAGLQTLPKDTLESAMIDGANRWERIRYVVMPHLTPLATFVGLVLLMDNFRVFEPIIGFSAEANATSLSWSIYNDLNGQVDQLFGSAAATSILTMIGVIILLSPVLVRTWREFKRKAH
ncbi:sugar ABC transporter permease [Pseudooceanicola sediminis]|uniref:Sugar ABC transporter permease n=1 Tax=Pseudooceanicola sediminis TaxID=2211117 RepID=A0A399J342_9RHOB|nr:sugar ABC transporter permease [Pseudooceanicola sediminis]KAA2314994.1 sugar ABC transporter permease [Puniceibacterium sp. HSS470]RII37366.1 sugar ABC transporter permease [Pseudooceanicola sediminis]|tara:strand:- start:49564 stop:50595 length:1032 start_codon:yes stop_codon:yes gene_type:complete